MTKSFWQRLLVALIVTFYLRHKIISSFGDIIADPIIERGENNVDVDETTKEMGEAKPPPIEGKVPTCMTPQNEVCVKPYSVPQKVDCLVRKRQAIDSSGSWLLPEDFMYKFDRSFADAVLDRVISGSALELGAGLGCYTHYFHDSGKLSSIAGYEGATNVEAMSEGFIQLADLTKKQDFGGTTARKYDWVICMEVAEHIPREFEHVFLLNLVASAQKGVLLSWGLPDQNGIGHVNLRSNEYVIDTMKKLGFEFDGETSEYVRSQSEFNWFKGTTMVFLNTMKYF